MRNGAGPVCANDYDSRTRITIMCNQICCTQTFFISAEAESQSSSAQHLEARKRTGLMSALWLKYRLPAKLDLLIVEQHPHPALILTLMVGNDNLACALGIEVLNTNSFSELELDRHL